MTRKTKVSVGAVVAVLVVLGSIGRSQIVKMRARFEGRRPALDVMKLRPSDLALRSESFAGTNPDGTRIAGWWLPSESPAGNVVMVHGFGQNKSAMLHRAATLVAAGWNVALIDLRARGESGGDRADIGPGAAFDVRAAVDALTGKVEMRILKSPTHKLARCCLATFTQQAGSTSSRKPAMACSTSRDARNTERRWSVS